MTKKQIIHKMNEIDKSVLDMPKDYKMKDPMKLKKSDLEYGLKAFTMLKKFFDMAKEGK